MRAAACPAARHLEGRRVRGLKLRRIAVWLMNMEYIDNTSGFIITYYIAAYIYIMVKCTTVILLTSGRARRSLWRLEGGKTNDGRALNGRRQACRHGSKGRRDGRLSAMPLLTPWFYFCPPKIRNRGVLRETLRKNPHTPVSRCGCEEHPLLVPAVQGAGLQRVLGGVPVHLVVDDRRS